MIKESKNRDFYTSGKQPSEMDFARISHWIKQQKLKLNATKKKVVAKNK
jgi:uncharacterized membrane protein (GlpM family)